MGQTGQYPIPEPIGGLPEGVLDFCINLAFCIGFAIAFGISVFHQFNPRRRTCLTISTRSITVERMVVTSMRMAASLRTNARAGGLTEYMQIALSAGYITLSEEQLYLLVCALTQATRDGVAYDDWKQLAEKDPRIKEKRRQEREKYRKWASNFDWFARIIQWIQVVIYVKWSDGSRDIALLLNCISFFGNLATLIVIASLLAMVYRVKGEVEHLNPTAVQRIKLTLTILLFVPLFRSTVSFRTSTSTTSSPPSALPAKIAFYLFQLLPELLSCLITACTDYRGLCDTGKWGDHPRWRAEHGMSEMPRWFVTLGHIFCPWKWPGLIRARSQREEQNATIQSSASTLYSNGDCEKVLPNLSIDKWQSSIETSTVFSSQLDEKESIRSQPLSTSSRTWSAFDSSKSIISDSMPAGTKLPATPSPLITDVKLWRPRLPPGISKR